MKLDQVNSAIAIGHFRLMRALVIEQSFGHNYPYFWAQLSLLLVQIVFLIGHSMVFKILRAMVNNGFEVKDGLDDPLSLKSAFGL